MRYLSLMYEKSGGCDHRHTCSECRQFFQPDKKLKRFACARHPEGAGTDWRGNWLACKFFEAFPDARQEQEKKKEKINAAAAGPTEEIFAEHQMTIDEWIAAEGI